MIALASMIRFRMRSSRCGMYRRTLHWFMRIVRPLFIAVPIGTMFQGGP